MRSTGPRFSLALLPVAHVASPSHFIRITMNDGDADSSIGWLARLAAAWRAGGASITGGGRAAIATAATGSSVSVINSSTAVVGGADEKKEHLVVMVHGLFGNRANWRKVADEVGSQLDASSTLFFCSTANEFHKVSRLRVGQ